MENNDDSLNRFHFETMQWLESLPVTDDNWLEFHPEAKAAVEKGLEQAAQGKTRRLGSFAQYADLDSE